MAKQLIIVSPAEERLVLDIGRGTIESVRGGVDDDVTHLIVEPKAEAVSPSPASAPRRGEPPAELDIIMSFVGGRPAAASDRVVVGPVSATEVAAMLNDLPEGSSQVVVLRSGHGR